MEFAVGYQHTGKNEEPFVEIINDYKNKIEEIYFPWLNMPSGRSPLTEREGMIDWHGQRKLESDLNQFKEMGIKLNLLLNANCYGGDSLSINLYNRICSLVDYLLNKF